MIIALSQIVLWFGACKRKVNLVSFHKSHFRVFFRFGYRPSSSIQMEYFIFWGMDSWPSRYSKWWVVVSSLDKSSKRPLKVSYRASATFSFWRASSNCPLQIFNYINQTNPTSLISDSLTLYIVNLNHTWQNQRSPVDWWLKDWAKFYRELMRPRWGSRATFRESLTLPAAISYLRQLLRSLHQSILEVIRVVVVH